jgi:hypothetical protein
MQQRDQSGGRKKDAEWELTFAPCSTLFEGELCLALVVG